MTRAQLQSLTDELVTAYNSWTVPAILAIRAPHCQTHYPPASLKRPPLNNDDFAKYMASQIPLFKKFTLTLHDTIIDPDDRKIVLHVSSTADTPVGPYANEYVLMIWATEDCTKVEKFVEFLDSWQSVRFFSKLQKWVAEREQQSRNEKAKL